MNLFHCHLILLLALVLLSSAARSSPIFKRPPVILMVGAPFSGKGTQADRLSRKLGLPVLQSGDLFRREVASGSELGSKMATYMNSGQLIPDELTIDLITKTLMSPEYESGVIMDGYPRNLDHLHIFENILNSTDMGIDAIVYLDAAYDLLLSRVEGRLVCRSCSRPVSNPTERCCDNPDLVRRADDSIASFQTRYKVFEENTIPLIETLKSRFPEKFIHVSQEALATKDRDEVEQLILTEFENLSFKRIRKPYVTFDGPFEWLLRLVKAESRPILKEDLEFYLNWALDCNKPDQSGLWRRVVFISTTSKPKFLEYRRAFLLYGIEVIRFPVFDHSDPRKENVYRMLMSEFESPSFSAIAMLSDTSNLYKPLRQTPTIEELESGSIPLCSMRNGVSCTNYCVLTVTYVTKSKDAPSQLKSYKIVDHVDGVIRTEVKNTSPFARVFGWDAIFFVKGLDKSYQELADAGYKNSARDRTLSAFLRKHVHYKSSRNLNFNAVTVNKSVDFSVNLRSFFEGIREYNLELVQEYGFTNIWRQALKAGVFLRAAAFRRIGIYWNPGVNGGLPLVKKADHIHEITYMAHDIGHQLLPDLVYTGNNSYLHKRVYIMWRMMSEAFTMALTDMIFIDALKRSGIEYDFGKRKIYPLFQDLHLDVSPHSNPYYLETVRSIVHANFIYCLKGDDSEYRKLIIEAAGSENDEHLFDALEAFKAKYAPFFVEDFRWTEQNYHSMVSTRSHEAKKWWPAVHRLNDLLGEHRIRSIEDFIADIAVDGSEDVPMSRMLEIVFDCAFRRKIAPVISSPASFFDLDLEPEAVRKYRAFVRWMIGQLSICFKYDFLPESKQLFHAIEAELMALRDGISDEDIARIRGMYEAYLTRLQDLSLISADDFATYSQVYPLFDPFFVNYDKSVEEYEDLASLSTRILDDVGHHYESYHRQAERILERPLADFEKRYLNHFYLMIERGGGIIMDGLFVVEPGVLLLTEVDGPETGEGAVSILLSGISIETSLEFIAHHETKVARLTSSKTRAMSTPLFEINNNDQQMMKLIKLALKTRPAVSNTDPNYENINMTLPAAKSTAAVFTATLKDWHSILIGRLGNPKGNETAVIKVATRICNMLHARYPTQIAPLDYYLNSKNLQKYQIQAESSFAAVQSRILPEAWGLFAALNIPFPPAGSPETAAFITLADFNARITYFSFSKTMPASFADSVRFVKRIVCGEGHASILSAYQVTKDGKTRRTKELFTELGWEQGLEPLIH